MALAGINLAWSQRRQIGSHGSMDAAYGGQLAAGQTLEKSWVGPTGCPLP